MQPTLEDFSMYCADELYEVMPGLLARYPIFTKMSHRAIRNLSQIERIEGGGTVSFIEDCAVICNDFWSAATIYYWLQGKRMDINSYWQKDDALTAMDTLHSGLTRYEDEPFIRELKELAFISFTECFVGIHPQTRGYLRSYIRTKQLQQELRRNPCLVSSFSRERDWLLHNGCAFDDGLNLAVYQRFDRLQLPCPPVVYSSYRTSDSLRLQFIMKRQSIIFLALQKND